VSESLDIMFRDVIHRLSAVRKNAAETAVDRLPNGPLEIVAIGALAEDRRPDAGLKVFVPQPVKPVLAKQRGWEAQLLADDEKAGVCTDRGV